MFVGDYFLFVTMDDEQHYSLAFLVRGLALSERMIRSFLTIFITKNIVRIYFTRL